MCGILGIYLFRGKGKVSASKLVAYLKHRGPDNTSVRKIGKLTLGHTRLSIIDTSNRANQPMERCGGRYSIVFNGEIYNYRELRKDLEREGRVFRTESDTEVLLELYARYGRDLLSRLKGMFAFAIYDKKTDTLFLARDRIGEKPLYYAQTDSGFIFSSELPPIIESGLVKKEINPIALGYYFLRNFYNIPEPNTLIKGVYKLRPGHFMIVRKGKVVGIERYWNPEINELRNKREVLSKLKEIIPEAVKANLVADVPVSITLSGGIDSSIIAYETAKTGKKLVCYTIGEGSDDEDIRAAGSIAERFGFEHKITSASKIDFLEKLDNIVETYGEPISNWSIVYTYVLSKRIREDGIKVTLSGAGGDEIFYGYPYTWKLVLLDKINRMARGLQKIPVLYGLTKEVFGRYGASEAERAALKEAIGLPKWKIKGAIYRVSAKSLERIFEKAVYREIEKHDYGEIFDDYCELLGTKRQYVDYAHWCALLVENQHSMTLTSDMGGMLNSVEIRAPFLYHPLVELGFSIPYKYKFELGGGKKIIKEMYRDSEIEDILRKKKRGFGYRIDIKGMIFGKWKDKIMKVLKESWLLRDGILRKDWLDDILAALEKGDKRYYKDITSTYTLEIWYRKFIGRGR